LLKTKNETDIASETLKDQAGNSHTLTNLMGDNKQMMVIHNMGKSCVYCTLWADGFSGVFEHMKNRIPTIFVSPDDPATQKEFAESRGWNFDSQVYQFLQKKVIRFFKQQEIILVLVINIALSGICLIC